MFEHFITFTFNKIFKSWVPQDGVSVAGIKYLDLLTE